jgi:WD40 repeat protein
VTTVFISHSSKDNLITRNVHEWLNQQGYGPVFLDLSPDDGMIGGMDWWRQLAENVKRAKIFLILASASSAASRVCHEELTIALSERKPIIILRLDGADLDPYLDHIQFIDFRAPDPDAWRRLTRALTEAGADPAVFEPDQDRPPFPGLPAFDVEDSGLYFGRETAISDLLTRLDQRRLGAKRLLVIAGPSGSGKSSLLRAGLIARLRRKREDWIAIKPFRPSRGFDEGVVRALESTCADWYRSAQALHTLRQLADPASVDPVRFAGFFRRLADEPGATPVLAIDQGEELLSGESGGAIEAIADTLAGLLTADSPVLGLITIRSDMLSALQQHPALGPLIMDDIYALPPMPRERYTLLIDGPIAQYAHYVLPGASVEPELRDALIEEATGADALPLVAFTLRTLWDEYARSDGRLIASQLKLIGGVGGAVAKIADQIVAAATGNPASGELDALRTAFVPGLAGVTENGEIVRRHVQEDLLPAEARPLLDQFVQARLLVRGNGPGGHPYLEIAHEALLRQWPVLAEWLQQDADALRTLEELGRAAAAWQRAGRNPELLAHRGEVLAKALLVVERDLIQRRYSAPERDTIQAYLASCQELERERAGRQFSLEITLATAFYERVQRETGQLRLIHALALCGAALDSNPYIRARDEVIASCGAADVLRARSLAWRVRSEVHVIFTNILFRLEFRLQGRSGYGTRLIFHPDNETLSVIGGDEPFDITLPAGTVQDWKPLPRGKILHYLPEDKKVLLINGQSAIVAKRGSRRALQETSLNGRNSDALLKARLCAHRAIAIVINTNGCFLVDFSSNQVSDLLAETSEDSRELLYSISTSSAEEIAVAGSSKVYTIDPLSASVKRYESGQTYALNAVEVVDGENEIIILGGSDSAVYVLKRPSGEVSVVGRHDDSISSLALMESDKLVLSTGWDGRAAIWDVEQRRHVLDLPTEGGMLRASAASPGGDRLAIAGDHEIAIWRRIRHRPVIELPHGGMITGVACHQGFGGRIVSVSSGGERCAALWTLNEGKATPLDLAIRASVQGVSMAPTGDIFAVCGDIPHVVVYSTTGNVIRRFVSEREFEDRDEELQLRPPRSHDYPPGSPGVVRNVSVSHDSSRIAWVAPTGRICIGDIRTGDIVIALPDAKRRFSTVCFSPVEDAFLAVTEQGEAYWIHSDSKPRLLIRGVTYESTSGRGSPTAFSHDGTKLAIATGGSSITIISLNGEEPELRLDGHTETFMRGWTEFVGALAFDPQGDFLVSSGSRQSTGTDPRTIRLWDPCTGDQLMRISINADCLALAVDPFSDTICAGYGDKVSLIPFHRWLLSSDTGAIRKKLEGMLGSSYEYVV